MGLPLSFTDTLKKFFGKKEEPKRNYPKTPLEKFVDFVKSMLYALVAALFIITFFVQNTRIPTGSMEDTILVGDFVLVNKFIYGPSTPRYIPFTEVALPHFKFPAIKDPHKGDVVVFEWPGNRDVIVPETLNVNYVKRCIGEPGDTIEIKDKVAFVNGEEYWIPPHIKYLSPMPEPACIPEPRIFPKNKRWNKDNYGPLVIPKEGDTIELTAENIMMWETTIEREYKAPVLEYNGEIISAKRTTIIKRDSVGGDVRTVVKSTLYGSDSVINADEYVITKVMSRNFEGRYHPEEAFEIVETEIFHAMKPEVVTIEGEQVTSYTFKDDYYFMMGDNRDDSLDSRYWGLVSRESVVGEAFIVLFSWDRDIPFSKLFKLLGSVRLDRVLKLIG